MIPSERAEEVAADVEAYLPKANVLSIAKNPHKSLGANLEVYLDFYAIDEKSFSNPLAFETVLNTGELWVGVWEDDEGNQQRTYGESLAFLLLDWGTKYV